MEGTQVQGLPCQAHVYLPVGTQMLSKHRKERADFLFKLQASHQ